MTNQAEIHQKAVEQIEESAGSKDRVAYGDEFWEPFETLGHTSIDYAQCVCHTEKKEIPNEIEVKE